MRKFSVDERLKKRILMFQVAGVINLVLGVYVLFEGPAVLPRDTVLLLVLFFLGFAVVDFYFPYAIKKKWLEDQARRAAGRNEVKGEG